MNRENIFSFITCKFNKQDQKKQIIERKKREGTKRAGNNREIGKTLSLMRSVRNTFNSRKKRRRKKK